MTSLAGLLDVVRADLPTSLVTPSHAARLELLSSELPLFAMAGFECRLGPAQDTVDLQVGSRRGDDTLRAGAEAAGRSASWTRAAELGRAWSIQGSELHDAIAEVWLEFDVDDGADERGSGPSVFALLEPDAAPTIPRALLEVLGAAGDDVVAVLERCATAAPAGAGVSHVGVMLGRTPSPVRLHVSRVALADCAGYLTDIRWPGDAHAIQALIRDELGSADVVTLCFDVVGDLQKRIGIEASFHQKRGLDPRWQLIFDRLVETGRCTRAKADALLGWPGTVTPLSLPRPWPDTFIALALREPETVFGVVERRLSHVKLTCDGAGSTTAKAYFGCGHLWLRQGRSRAPLPQPAIAAAGSLGDAEERATEFLLRSANQIGWWCDYFERAKPAGGDADVKGYASDEWVTAYAAVALAGVPDAAARRASEHALDLLMSRRRVEPGWGCHAFVPADADTTSWVLRLAGRLGCGDVDRLRAAAAMVRARVDASGGTRTYAVQDGAALAAFTGLDGSYAGWCAAHACVTAVAASADQLRWLARSQRSDGYWRGYWWDDDEYTTAHAVAALAGTGWAAEAVGRAGQWAAERIGPAGAVASARHGGPSPFATALALRTLAVAGGDRNAANRACAWLLAEQLASGCWTASAWLRIPQPDVADPYAGADTAVRHLDDAAIFTTATVLDALGECRLAGFGEP